MMAGIARRSIRGVECGRSSVGDARLTPSLEPPRLAGVYRIDGRLVSLSSSALARE